MNRERCEGWAGCSCQQWDCKAVLSRPLARHSEGLLQRGQRQKRLDFYQLVQFKCFFFPSSPLSLFFPGQDLGKKKGLVVGWLCGEVADVTPNQDWQCVIHAKGMELHWAVLATVCYST